MPEATVSFPAPAAASRLVGLLADPSFVARAIPQVVGVEKTSETTARWTVLVKLGPISKKSVYHGELVDRSEGGVRFRADGPEATIEGRVEVASAGSEESRVTLTLTMTGKGALRTVIDSYLRQRVQADAVSFGDRLREQLRAGPSSP